MAAGEEGHTAAGAPGYESTALPGSVAERAAPEVKETPRRSSEGGAAAEGGAARRGSLSSLLRGAARGREEPLKGQDGWPSPAQAGERRNSGPEMQRKGSTFSGRARTADSAGLVQADFAEGSVGIRDLDVQDLQELRELKEARERREQELVNAYIKNHSDAIGGRASLRRSQSSIARMTWKQLAVHRLISHWAFDSGMGVIICCNAMTIGVESTYTAKDIAPPTWVEVVEYIFISVYTVELALRLFVDRLKAFQSLWVKFDAFLVACGLMDIIVKILANGSDVLANVMLVRLLRLARLARAARLLVQFRVLWLLVQGLINSFLTIMWTFVIMVVLIYIFAVLGLEVVRPDEGAGEEYQIAVTMFNDSLGRCMLVG
ncbi:unnamed protein product [Prorocentrum cordatum]|uniref:Ion transport domain-containing protein n=1 Tax=Prorocentrum cordatum TaxID=2364126 RepID=A0ABN9UK67_9DINO|nr:unnamed protein product [Polarella glacialis]